MKPILYNTVKSFLLFSIFFSLFSAAAQAPSKMSYQAVVRNANNALIAGANVGIQISIIQTTATGAAVFVERHTPTTNLNGLATIEIGGGTLVSGDFATIDWANGPYFIKTETDPTGGITYTISGTNQLLSVPFALFAANSGGSSNGWNLNGNVATASHFIGTTNDEDVFFKRNGIIAGRLGLGNTGGGTSFGTHALASNPGIDNTAIGTSALRNNTTGFRNTANGASTLQSNTTGGDNTAIGTAALFNNTTSSNNTATGSGTLSNNITGNNNTSNGKDGLFSNTTGSDNTACGVGTLFSNTSGNRNTAIGEQSLFSNTIGDFNTATGRNALRANTIGISNTANGVEALANNTTGIFNTAIGVEALNNNTTGSLNTASGVSALFNNTTGNNNTGTGTDALFSNTTGSSNTATGREALTNNTIGGNNTANGVNALLENTEGNDNTANGRSSLRANTTGVSNTANGKDALFNSTTGNNNTALGRGTLSGVTTGNNNTGIGFDAQVASPTASNQVRVGNTAVALASVQVAWTVTSDKRWKSNIQKSNLGLDFIKQLNPVFYTRKDVQINEGKTTILETTANPTLEYGFIAQELEATLNKFDTKKNGIISKDEAGMYGVRYNDLIAPMVKAIQEQQAIIEAQSKTIDAILKRLEALEN